jgi:TonB-linked SusC/RagA family outer membrane protein
MYDIYGFSTINLKLQLTRMKKALLILSISFLWLGSILAQGSKISGKVVASEDGSPLAGVSISIKGKSSGVQTTKEGTFTIAAGPKDLLVVSFVGYQTQEIRLGESLTVEVSLKPDGAKLGEVVVIGYGTQSRRNVTSAISKLDADVLASVPRANIGSALQGSVSGLQVVNSTGTPGAAPLIILRGGASINNPGSPLVVVDGIIRAYNDISSNDIESIELLKDAAATAIYGARANNGVILITTKQGKVGSAQISYKYTTGFNKNRPGYEFMNAKDFIYYNRLGNLNSQRTLAQVNATRGYGLLTGAPDLGSFDIRAYTPANANLLSMGWDTVGDPYGGTIIFKDHGGEMNDIVFRNTRTQDHFVNLTGGNDKGKYYASFNYYNEDGVVIGSKYKRFTADINGSYKVKPNVEVSSSVNMSTSSQLGTIASESNTFYRSLAVWPTFNPWLDSAKTLANPGNSNTDGNPVYWLNKTKRTNEVNRITASAGIKWDITKNLYLKATGAAYLLENLDESFTKATQLYPNVFATPQTYNNTSRPSVASFSRSFQTQYNAILNYTKTFDKRHNVNAMVGAEFFDTRAFDMQVYGTIAPTDEIPTANASTVFAAGNNYSTRSEYAIASTFGRLNYDYDQRYLLSLVFRRDGVSSLSADNRFGFFPGLSAGWNMHREKFFKNSSLSNIITTFKPRVSYGQNGNVAGLGRYEVQGAYGAQTLYNNNGGFLYTGISNTDLRWEKSKTTDLGLDLGFLGNRVTFVFDYFDRVTSDLLTNLALPSYTGFSSVKTNLGSYLNKGYEFTLNTTVLNKPSSLRLELGANASFVKNKILKLPFNGNENNRQGGLQIYDPVTGKVIWVGGLQEGKALGDMYAFKQLSIFKDDAEVAKVAGNRWDQVALIGGPGRAGINKIAAGDVNWLDIDKNDTIDSRDQVNVGNIYPKWTGGFTLNLSYKGFSLYTRFEFATGHTIYNDLLARTLGNMQGTLNYFVDQKNAWSTTNTNSDLPRVYYADQVAAPIGKKNYTRINNAGAILNSNNSRMYEKGDYFAGREITLSYDLSRGLLSKSKIFTKGRVYVSGSNLFYVTKFSGATPEPPVSGGAMSGFYNGTYPVPKSFVVGVDVSF